MDRSTAYRVVRIVRRATGAMCIPRSTPPTWIVDVYTPLGRYITSLHHAEDLGGLEDYIRAALACEEA
jgi:hypothetical protein